MKRKPKDIERQLIDAIRGSGLSRGAVSRLTGVDLAAVSRLLAGKRSITLRSAAKVARALGLELRKVED